MGLILRALFMVISISVQFAVCSLALALATGNASATTVFLSLGISIGLSIFWLRLMSRSSSTTTPKANISHAHVWFYVIAIPIVYVVMFNVIRIVTGSSSPRIGIGSLIASVSICVLWWRVFSRVIAKPHTAQRIALSPLAVPVIPAHVPPTIRIGEPTAALQPMPIAPNSTPPLTPPAPRPPQTPTQSLESSLIASAAALPDDVAFEQWVADLLTYIGWQNVQRVGGRGDRGVDIRGIYNGEKCIVQCKHWPGRIIPPNEVRALIGTLHIQRAKRAYLITSGRFGDQCFIEIQRKPVELWDLSSLAIHVRNAQL